MSNYTKGPWEWRDGSLCQVGGGRLGMTYSYNCANRTLIAAAPELLESLESLVHAVLHEVELRGRMFDAIENAQTAIAKAKGE